MSTAILPFEVWPEGILQARFPANENALRLEALSREIISQAVTAQPGSPSDGDTYIIAATHTGAQWATFSPKDIAIYRGGTWYAWAPVEGLVVNVAGSQYKYDGGAWTALGGGGAVAAEDVSYDNATSGLTATDVQAAIDEVAGLSPSATIQCIPIACSDESTALTTGAAKVTFRMPFAFTLAAVRASVTTAPTGSVLTVDINEAGASILSTKLTIDASEKTSTTAAAPAVISDTSLADDAEMTIDIDGVGSTIAGAGLKVYLIGTKT